MLAKAGYSKEAAGGLLAAGGIGAILSPPVLGAAAFLIAEFLHISYLDVILMATIPTCLYYWSIFLMVEFDAKKFGAKEISIDQKLGLLKLTYTYGFHFLSLIVLVLMMVIGYTPMMAVFFAILTCFLSSFIRSETGFTAPKLVEALKLGTLGVLNIAVVCACAGIIVGVVSLTGVGLKLSTIIISYAGGSLLLTAIYTADTALGPRPCRSCNSDVYHCGRHCSAGPYEARGARLRGAYVHLLLRRPFGSFTADCSFPLCSCRPYRWRSVQNNDDGLEIHRGGLCSTFHVCSLSFRAGLAAEGRQRPRRPVGHCNVICGSFCLCSRGVRMASRESRLGSSGY